MRRLMMKGGAALALLLLVGSSLALAAPKPAPAAASSSMSSSSASSRRSRSTAIHGVVNLNVADEAALELLPGIGETKAKRIVEYRHGHPFRRVEDLVKVKGIGKKTLARLKPYLAVTGATTLGEDAPAAAPSSAASPSM
jgi:competence protein ComEA